MHFLFTLVLPALVCANFVVFLQLNWFNLDLISFVRFSTAFSSLFFTLVVLYDGNVRVFNTRDLLCLYDCDVIENAETCRGTYSRCGAPSRITSSKDLRVLVCNAKLVLYILWLVII